MNRSIYLATDPSCWTMKKIQEGKMGGTENFFFKLRNYLISENYDVFDPIIRPTIMKVDLAIHSNSFNYEIEARQHLCWVGSWHGNTHEPKIDKIIMVSKFMKDKTKCDRAIIIPAPYDHKLDGYKTSDYVLRRIVTTSNPNRHFQHTVRVASILKEKGVDFEWHLAGGNILYSDKFGECYDFRSSPNIQYRGVLPRHDLLGLLTTAHVWAYPCLSDESETLCCSALEAMALGIPTILPKREPFVSNMPDAFLVENEEEMANKIEDVLNNGPNRIRYDVSKYSEDTVMPQVLKEIEEML